MTPTQPQRPPLARRIRNVLSKVMLLLLVFEVVWVGAAGARRLQEALVVERWNTYWMAKHAFFYRVLHPHPRLGFVVGDAEGSQVFLDNEYGYVMDQDELGFRNEAQSKEQARLVFLGGAFTYGAPLARLSFVEQMEEPAGFEISNFALFYYRPWQYLAVMKEWPEFFRNRTIVVSMTPKDLHGDTPADVGRLYDEKGWSQFETFEEAIPGYWLSPWWRNTVLGFLLSDSREPTPPKSERKGLCWFWGNGIDPEVLRPGEWSRLIDLLGQMNELARGYNSRLVVLLWPGKAGVVGPDEVFEKCENLAAQVAMQKEAFARLTSAMEGLGIPTVDMQSPLEEMSNLGPVFDPYSYYQLAPKSSQAISARVLEEIRARVESL